MDGLLGQFMVTVRAVSKESTAEASEPARIEGYNVHRVVTACSASPAAPALQRPTDERHVMDNDTHRAPSVTIVHGESVPFTPTVSRPLPSPVDSRPTSPVTGSQSVPLVGAPCIVQNSASVPSREDRITVDRLKAQEKLIILEPTSLAPVTSFPTESSQCLMASLPFATNHILKRYHPAEMMVGSKG